MTTEEHAAITATAKHMYRAVIDNVLHGLPGQDRAFTGLIDHALSETHGASPEIRQMSLSLAGGTLHALAMIARGIDNNPLLFSPVNDGDAYFKMGKALQNKPQAQDVKDGILGIFSACAGKIGELSRVAGDLSRSPSVRDEAGKTVEAINLATEITMDNSSVLCRRFGAAAADRRNEERRSEPRPEERRVLEVRRIL